MMYCPTCGKLCYSAAHFYEHFLTAHGYITMGLALSEAFDYFLCQLAQNSFLRWLLNVPPMRDSEMPDLADILRDYEANKLVDSEVKQLREAFLLWE